MADEATFEPSSRSDYHAVKRMPERARYDEATVFKVVDESLICHVAFQLEDEDGGDRREEWPVAIPMGFGRVEDTIFLHGHLQSRLLKALSAGGTRVSMTFTNIQTLVVARSAFHNSFRYRSAVLFGVASLIPPSEVERKTVALTAVTNHPFKAFGGDRWNDCRMPTETEIKSTRVVEVKIELASAKVSSGGPNDDQKDLEDPQVRDGVWAGEVVLKQGYQEVRQSGKEVKAPVPAYVKQLLQL